MCGILGIYNLEGSPINKGSLVEMGNQISHRGPDGEGHYINSNIGLGHRRLAILDLSEAGHQPMIDEEFEVLLTGNDMLNSTAIEDLYTLVESKML